MAHPRLPWLLWLVVLAAAAARYHVAAQIASRSPSPTITRSPSYTPTASLTPSVTASSSVTPSFTASVTVTPTPTAFACPVAVAGVPGATPARPGVAAGVVECGGHGVCTRDGAARTGGRCVCDGVFEGGGGGCESCPVGLYQAETCADCSGGGGGPCVVLANRTCSALDAGGACAPGSVRCTAVDRAAATLRTMACAACPALSVTVNGTGATVRTPCSGHGTCNQYDGACYCAAGWRGDDCATPAAAVSGDACDGVACSGAGVCAGGVCTCLPGYTGAACQFRTPVAVTYFWRTTGWSACSRDCGSGSAQRTAVCMEGRNDVLQNNFTVRPAAAAALCSSFTRPALVADCRTVMCGGSVASFWVQVAANASLLGLADVVDTALATAVVGEIAAALHATVYPAVSTLHLAARLQALAVLPARAVDAAAAAAAALVKLEWISANTAAPDGVDLSAASFAAALTAAVASNTSTLRTTSTYMRAVLPMSATMVTALYGTNDSLPAYGLLFSNLSSSSALLPASDSFFDSLTVGQIIGFACGVAGGILVLGCAVYLVWRWSLRSAASVGVWTGRDRRTTKDAPDDGAAVVVRPDGAGGLQIVRTKSSAAMDAAAAAGGGGMGERRQSMGGRRPTGSAMGERRVSGAGFGTPSMGERRVSGAGFAGGGMGERRASGAGMGVGMGERRASGAGMGVGMGERRASGAGFGGGGGMGERRASGAGLRPDGSPPQGGDMLSPGMGGRRASGAGFVDGTAPRDQPDWVRGGRSDWMSPGERRASFHGGFGADGGGALPPSASPGGSTPSRSALLPPAATVTPSGVVFPTPARTPSFSPGSTAAPSGGAGGALPPVRPRGPDAAKVNDVRSALVSAAADPGRGGGSRISRSSGPLAAAALAEADARVAGMFSSNA